jgi:hypothetical protein
MYAVAPHAGAWIETGPMSALTRGGRVAPHAGAWIETGGDAASAASKEVAPHAGAWIETAIQSAVLQFGASRPPRGGVD